MVRWFPIIPLPHALLFLSFQSALCILFHATVDQILSEIHNGRTCEDIISEYLSRIGHYDTKGPQLRTITMLNPRVKEEAKELDEFYQTAKNFRGRLHCVPILVSGNIDVAGVPTAPGIGEISDSIPQIHSKVVHLLTSVGAIVIGKTSLPPFGDELRPAKGLTLNAFDTQPTQTGLEAALATGFAVFGIGTDTFGSLVQSAAANNLLAFRPTWTRISNQGIMPDFYLQQTPVILTRSAKDLAIVMDILDPVASAHNFALYTAPRVLDQNSFTGLNIGVPSLFAFDQFDFFHPFLNGTAEYRLSKEMRKIFGEALTSVESLGGQLHNLTLPYDSLEPYMEEIAQLWYNLSSCKVSWMDAYFANSDRFPPTSPYHSFSEMVESRNIPEEIKLSFKPHLANRHLCPGAAESFGEIRKLLTDSLFKPLFKGQDVLLLPTSADFQISSKRPPLSAFNDISQKFSPALIAAILGYPCITLPTGFSGASMRAPQGRPAGVLFIAQPTKMDLLVRIAFAYQTNFPKGKVPWTVNAYRHNEHNSAARNWGGSGVFISLFLAIIAHVIFKNYD